jgi:hypothetical protein
MTRLKWGTRTNPLAGYFAWEDWRLGGRVGPRPYLVGGATNWVPLWAWDLYKKRNPSPVPVTSASIIASKGMYTAWGFDNGQFNPDVFIPKLKQHGYQWLCIQSDESYVMQEPKRERIIQVCNQVGVKLGIWEDIFTKVREPYNASVAVNRWQAQFYHANVEGYVSPIWASNFRQFQPKLECAIYTDFRGMDTQERAKPWIDAGFLCVTECYLSQNPYATPANLDFRAWQIGWPTSYPCISNYNNVDLAYYRDKMTQKSGAPFKYFSVYLAEYMRDEDWTFSL